MDASKEDSGRWWDTWHLLLTLSELFWWWWLVSSRFLTRTSCHKIIHANGYYGAWLVWVVSARMFPLTEGPVGVNTPKFQAWSV